MANVATDDFSDLTELGIDINEDDELTSKFDKCVQQVQLIASTLNNETLLKFYAFYKQSLEGACNTQKPSWYDMKGKAKWEAWNALGNMNKNEAKSHYVKLLLQTCPDFNFNEAGSKKECWVRVSSLAEEPPILEKNICDYIRSGEIKKVTDHLKAMGNSKYLLDNDGMGLLHYAADIGNAQILNLLLNDGFDVNLQDSEGQTALHYAASCGHIDCVKLLLERGAKGDIVDSDGSTPKDVATDNTIIQFLT